MRFTETQTKGVYLSLQVKRRIASVKTSYQYLEIVDTDTKLGRLLALDGKIQLTEGDEAFYHEMLAHPPLLSHPHPRRVLIIGGGDGGTLREALKHPVSKAVLVEIDAEVIKACRRHLDISQEGFDDERVEVVISSGEEFVKTAKQKFDVILVDSTDPIGPALALFEHPFFEACSIILDEGGILCAQTGTPFYQQICQKVHRSLRQIFPQVKLYLGFVPSYPSGLWSFCMAGGWLNQSLKELKKRYYKRGLNGKTVYYTPKLHQASAILPGFVEQLIS